MADEPELSKGVSSEWAQYLQQLLQQAGYWNGDIDGTFGDDLEQAVMQFQSAQGLSADGVVRSDTWDALTGGGASSAGGAAGDTGAGAGGDDQMTDLLDPSDYPEIMALVNSNDFDEYARSVVGVDPDAYQNDEDTPVA